MKKQEHQIRVDEKVRLKSDGQDSLYAHADAGAPAWVRDRKHDAMGYPMIFIEWDKDHWSYSGEPDRWTMEAHFEKNEEIQMGSERSPEAELFERFQRFLESENAPDTMDGNKKRLTLEDRRLDAIGKASEMLSDSDGFIIITVTKAGNDYAPKLVTFYTTTEAGVAAELMASRISSASYEELAIDKIVSLKENQR